VVVGSEVVVARSHLRIPQGTVLVVVGDALEVTGRLERVVRTAGTPGLETVAALNLSSGRARLDLAPGDYTLKLDTTFEQGNGPLYFGVRIV
jgi:hypothetical protein